MRLLGLFLFLAAGGAFAGESVVLATGARLHVDRHEIDGLRVRLYNGEGYLEIDAVQVQGFEADESVPSVPALASPVPAPAAVLPPTPSPMQLADAAADKYGLPRNLVRSVMAAESGFSSQAVSPKGAVGLMQLMPATAQILGVNPNDPVQNVDAGARYLRDLLVKYDGYLWHALAAYNAGPAAVDKYNGVPPYSETIHYVWKIDQALKKGAD
ncbi:Lytic transglycosylase, catalytic [Candidatus Sulfopaludibacter sp. SbA6]|nr:Lytic transglycosylase, catalytic [Candidatus Sulfopaludibacter sp. SbA6]